MKLIKPRSAHLKANTFFFLHLSTFLFFFLVFSVPWGLAQQQEPCGFDEIVKEAEMSDYNYIEEAEKQMKKARESGVSRRKMQYSIPVVVHVLHLGDGHPSKISEAQVQSAIDNLNDRFSGAVSSNGLDMEIDFCWAQRDHEGNPITGLPINYVNAFDFEHNGAYYRDVGMTRGNGGNEVELKALSIWPSCDYYNIWIVTEINDNDGGPLKGFAYPPLSSPDVDGSVVIYHAFGFDTGDLRSYTDQNSVITHETGHYLNLYHTFRGDNGGTICPPIETPANCMDINDKICDTDAHIRSNSDCNPTGTNACNNGTSNSNFVHNYMDYSSDDCKSEFTMKQKDRMRDALAGPRSCLVQGSLGCSPACIDVVAAFDNPGMGSGLFNVPVTFTNQSNGANSYVWYINDNYITMDMHLTHTFSAPGNYTVCLQAIGLEGDGTSCTDEVCYNFEALPDQAEFGCGDVELAPCELILDGDFTRGPSFYYSFGNDPELGILCNWFNRIGSPAYCPASPGALLMVTDLQPNSSFTESFGTINEVNFVDGENYTISLDYAVFRPDNNDPINFAGFQIGLSQTRLEGTSNTEPNELKLENINSIFENNTIDMCNFATTSWESDEFTFDESTMGRYLYIEPIIPSADGNYFLKITNIHINHCDCLPEPDFTFPPPNGCVYTFNGTNTGDLGTYTWNFGYADQTAEGPNVTHEFMQDGPFTVCLTITCPDAEDGSATICKEVTVTGCDNCTDMGQVEVILCEEPDGSAYLGEVAFQVPAGTAPCDIDPVVWSDDVNVWIENWNIVPIDANNSQFAASIYVAPPDGFAFPADVYFEFCDENGDRICYTGVINSTDCEICNDPITDDAVCNDQLSTFGMYVHEGSIDLLLPTGFAYLDDASNHQGYSGSIIPSNDGTTWVLDYTVVTPDANSGIAEVIIQFLNNSQQIECVRVIINLPEWCGDLCENSGVNCDVCHDEELLDMHCSLGALPGTFSFARGMQIDFPSNYAFCGFQSTDPNLVVSASYQSGTNPPYWSIRFDLITSIDGPRVVETIICFSNPSGQTECIPILLNIPSDPRCGYDGCIAWAPKCADLEGSSGNDILFSFNMTNLRIGYDATFNIDNIALCPFNQVDAIIEGGGTVTINSLSTNYIDNTPFYREWFITFNIDIRMPSGFDPNYNHILTIFLCDQNGNEICLEFPLDLSCGNIQGGSSSGWNNSIRFDDIFKIYPNPMTDQLKVVIEDFDYEAQYLIELYDLSGKQVKTLEQIESSFGHYEIHFLNDGLYLIKLLKNGEPIAYDKIFVKK